MAKKNQAPRDTVPFDDGTVGRYLQQDGQFCPFCSSTSVAGEGIVVDDVDAYQVVTCNDCGGSWREVFVLTGIVAIGGAPRLRLAEAN